jgi:endonuclease/exonuclease/phosphatase family metal-dependent hydrolase
MAGDGAVLAAGDFNSTNDIREFRGMLTDGYRDAAEQAGAPFAPTYPADRFTPVIAIDHVLTRNATGTGVQTVRVPGTDHMALIVDVALNDNAVS